MYLLPSEIFLTLYLLIPVALVVFRWQHAMTSGTLAMTCAALSWIFFNTFMVINPPDSGLAALVHFVIGWFWMLPLLGILLCVDFLLHEICVRFFRTSLRSRWGGILFRCIATVSLMVVFWGTTGWMSRERAIVEARRELSDHGYQIVGPADAVFAEGHWIVRYPQSAFKEISLNRNGGMSWIGGPENYPDRMAGETTSL